MAFKSDIEIAQSTPMEKITTVAKELGVADEALELYGNYKAKIDYNILDKMKDVPDGKLVLVTAITPTPMGEGKTTTTVGVSDALRAIGKKSVVALREPSLGPVFGVKGGAAGGGYSQVVPMEDINLHFTGDFHAIGAANNLLAAMLDNHIYQGNALGIDSRRITWKRAMDMNDRQLRFITDGLGGRVNGVPREDGFEITVASEIMAVLCLSSGIEDLKERLGRIIVGYTFEEKAVTAADLKAHGAMAALLKDALKPNLVQSLEHNPAFIHGGPFANIAHGCNSLMATRMALKFGDYAITEAGFGADLGAEKFIDIKCRMAGLKPSAVVIVGSIQTLRYHGGLSKEEAKKENMDALAKGMGNLLRHVDNIRNVFGLPAVVVINREPNEKELAYINEQLAPYDVKCIESKVWDAGGVGGKPIAEEIVRLCEGPNDFKQCYELDLPLEEKIRSIVQKVYRGNDVELTGPARKQLEQIEAMGYGGLPVCMAKTQFSFTDDAKQPGAPEDFKVTVRNLKVCAGAGFIVALTGDIMTMPGLPPSPSAERIDVDATGKISGLF